MDPMEWLLANSGPAIRFQAVTDLLREQDIKAVSAALGELNRSSIVSRWMERLGRGVGMNQLHSSNPSAFENVVGKLVELGMRAGLQPFDNKTLPFRVWLSEGTKQSKYSPFKVFLRVLVASFLSFAGYSDTQPVHEVLAERLDSLYSFAANPNYQDIYEAVHDTEKKEKRERKHRVVSPELCADQQFVLPSIHDIIGIAHSRTILHDPALRHKAEAVVSMIFSPEYQDLSIGYGTMKHQGRSYVIGWSVCLPGYNAQPSSSSMAKVLLYLQAFAQFKKAQESNWFAEMMKLLEACSTEFDTYRFPKEWLPEKKSGYWVNGAYMALEDDRRKASAIECESTFRMFKLKHLMGFPL
ncbi:MAG: hypothetical protein EAX95_00160 [Candidatus Thorarchaeota archaeon]|nr:hypothetical protein [Candidatus Thorarchaeota archaeon]